MNIFLEICPCAGRTVTNSNNINSIYDLSLFIMFLIPQHYYKLNFLRPEQLFVAQVFIMSEFSLILVLRKENKQNSDMT